MARDEGDAGDEDAAETRGLVSLEATSNDRPRGRLGDTHISDGPTDGGGSDELARGAAIGRYVLLERIGTGGMGMVYAAFDPELDRKVALKVLRPDLGRNRVQFRARMLREAQAMARLQHPNVIAVHDVGTFQERVFLAMELVDGGTLKQWLRRDKPSLRAIVDVFIHAGRGLAAAHAAGLVHRDFKPENVLIGTDGRARVTDFGLARSANSREEAPSEEREPPPPPPADDARDKTTRKVGLVTRSQLSADAAAQADVDDATTSRDRPSLDTALTRAGTVMGTPGYMAPEQCRGEPTDARSDQFSFCASLYEAVYRHRAFPGLTAEEIMENVVDGKIREAPADGKVPSWIRRILLRGLSVDPAARFPSMDALLDELSHDPVARRRRRLVAAGSAVAIAALVFVAQRWGAREVRMCQGAERKLAGVWDAAREKELRSAFAKSSKVYAAHAAEQSIAALDDYATRWAAMRTDACEATRLRGVETESMMALRMACLDERRRDLAALTDMLVSADDTTVENAVQATSALPALAACADVEALSAVAPLPTDPALQARIATARTRLAEARARLAAGKYAEGLALVEDVPAEAAALGYRPLAAEALELLGELRFKLGDYQGSDRAWKDAIYAAEESRLDQVKSAAAVRLADVTVDLHGYAEAHDWLRYAEAAVKRSGGRGDLQVELWISIALVHFRESRFAEAEAAARRAVSLANELAPMALGRANAYRTLGNVLAYEDRFDEALQLLEQAHAINAAVLGPEHPDTASMLRKEIDVYAMRGDGAHALELGRRVLAILSKSLAPDHLQVAQTHTNIAEALGMLGRYEEALAEERLALPTYERVFGPESEDVGVSCTNMGFALYKLGRDAEARKTLLRAIACYEKTTPADAPDRAEPMLTLGKLELRAGHAREAQRWFERAVALRAHDHDPAEMLAPAEVGLARALWSLGRDRERAIELAERARDQLAGGSNKEALAEATSLLSRAGRR